MSHHDLSGGTQVLEQVSAVARRVLSQYDFSSRSSVDLLTVSENATFKVSDPDTGQNRILRVHRHDYHQPGAVDSELNWLTALRKDTGIRTPEVIAARDGSWVVRDQESGRDCVLFELLPGSEPSPATLVQDFEALGALTARMHQHTRAWSRPAGFTRFHWDFDAAFGERPRWGRWQDSAGVAGAELAQLSRLQDRLRDRVAAYGTSAQRFGLIHADMRLANLLVVPGESVSVIDFDDCGWSWYLFDLAAALSFMEHDPRVPQLIDSWTRGYRTAAELAASDESEIWTFILFRRLLLLGWIGSHPAADMARDLSDSFAAGTCELAEQYLSTN